MVLPAALGSGAELAGAAAQAKTAGIDAKPHVDAANALAKLVKELQSTRAALGKAIHTAEGMHDNIAKQAEFLTSKASDAVAATRAASDALELSLPNEVWPLPKYREMLFPV